MNPIVPILLILLLIGGFVFVYYNFEKKIDKDDAIYSQVSVRVLDPSNKPIEANSISTFIFLLSESQVLVDSKDD